MLTKFAVGALVFANAYAVEIEAAAEAQDYPHSTVSPYRSESRNPYSANSHSHIPPYSTNNGYGSNSVPTFNGNPGLGHGGYGQHSYGDHSHGGHSHGGHGGYGGHGPYGGTTNHSHLSHIQSVNGHSPGYGGTGYGHFGTPGNEGNGAYYANSPWGNTENATRAGWWSAYQ